MAPLFRYTVHLVSMSTTVPLRRFFAFVLFCTLYRPMLRHSPVHWIVLKFLRPDTSPSWALIPFQIHAISADFPQILAHLTGEKEFIPTPIKPSHSERLQQQEEGSARYAPGMFHRRGFFFFCLSSFFYPSVSHLPDHHDQTHPRGLASAPRCCMRRRRCCGPLRTAAHSVIRSPISSSALKRNGSGARRRYFALQLTIRVEILVSFFSFMLCVLMFFRLCCGRPCHLPLRWVLRVLPLVLPPSPPLRLLRNLLCSPPLLLLPPPRQVPSYRVRFRGIVVALPDSSGADRLLGPSAPPTAAEPLVILLSVILSHQHNIRTPLAKITALQLMLQFATYLDDDVRLQRLVAYIRLMISDGSSPLVRGTAIRVLAKVVLFLDNFNDNFPL